MKDIVIYRKIWYFLTIQYIDIENNTSVCSIWRIITSPRVVY